MSSLHRFLISLAIFIFTLSSALLIHWLGQGAFVFGESLQNHAFLGILFGALFGVAAMDLLK